MKFDELKDIEAMTTFTFKGMADLSTMATDWHDKQKQSILKILEHKGSNCLEGF